MNRRKAGFGKRLAELHRWNGWLTAVLAVSGLLLAWGTVREWGEGRIWIRQLHLAVGIVSGILIVLYLPLAKRHLKQLNKRARQKGNLIFVLFLLLGWLLSGILLWQLRHFPPQWGNGARLVHQLLTYAGLPYVLYHSVTRLSWMRRSDRRAIRTTADPASADGAAVGAAHPEGPSIPGPWLNRRQFLQLSLGVALAAATLPSLFRWLGSVSGGSPFLPGGSASPGTDPNRMLPAPEPLPESASVIGGGAKGQFQVYTVTRLPVFASDTWRFTLDGLVERPSTWDWETFLRLPRTVQVSDFHCVTGWSVYRNTWEGIPLKQLLREAGVKPQAVAVKLYSGDGVYTDSLTLEQASMDDVLVAVLHDGKPIHRDYGGPARLIVPKMYAYKSVKWLDRIELIDREHIGYWEERGYDKDAWLKGQGLRT